MPILGGQFCGFAHNGCGTFFARLACGIGDAALRERIFASAIAGFRVELVQRGHALFLGQF